MEQEKIKLIIVDDHKMFLDGLVEMLSKSEKMQVIGTAANGTEALEVISQQQPDILISDIRMQEMDGFQLSKALKKSYPDIKTLIVSMHNEPITINKLLQEGVMGYILKNTGRNELFTAINSIHNGQTYFSDEVQKIYMNSMVSHKKKNQSIQLTKREREIVRLIAQEYTTGEIAEELFISLNTVETHRKNILKKLEVRNSIGIIKKTMELNLLEEPLN